MNDYHRMRTGSHRRRCFPIIVVIISLLGIPSGQTTDSEPLSINCYGEVCDSSRQFCNEGLQSCESCWQLCRPERTKYNEWQQRCNELCPEYLKLQTTTSRIIQTITSTYNLKDGDDELPNKGKQLLEVGNHQASTSENPFITSDLVTKILVILGILVIITLLIVLIVIGLKIYKKVNGHEKKIRQETMESLEVRKVKRPYTTPEKCSSDREDAGAERKQLLNCEVASTRCVNATVEDRNPPPYQSSMAATDYETTSSKRFASNVDLVTNNPTDQNSNPDDGECETQYPIDLAVGGISMESCCNKDDVQRKRSTRSTTGNEKSPEHSGKVQSVPRLGSLQLTTDNPSENMKTYV